MTSLNEIRKTSINKQELKALKYFINNLAEQLKNNLVLVKLFGSKARGESTRKSDIDVLVIAKKIDRRVEEKISGAIQDTLLNENVEFSVIAFNLNEYENLVKKHSLFMQNIQNDGIDLWNAA